MNGQRHYIEAEAALERAAQHENGVERNRIIQTAATHAVLALVAAAVDAGVMDDEVRRKWQEVLD